MRPQTTGREAVTAVVLAGGRGQRMQGADKGLITLAGQRLIDRVVQALAPQCHAVLINANRNLDRYRSTGLTVISDTSPDYRGPLAGIASVLPHVQTPLLLCVPCDSPFLGTDLRHRLQQALGQADHSIAVAHDGVRLQPTFCLLQTSVLASLESWLNAGGRKIDRWYEQLGYITVDFSDQTDMFININSPEDRKRAEDWYAGQS